MFKHEYDIEGDTLVFMNTFFDLKENRIYVKMYNTRNNKIYKLKDVSGFKPFFYTKQNDTDQILLETYLQNNKGVFEIVTTELYDGIDNQDIEVYKFQSDVTFNVYKKLKEELDTDQYEYLVKYYESYMLSNGFVTCGLYTLKNGVLYEKPAELDDKKIRVLEKMISNVKGDKQEYIEYLKNYTQLLSQEVPFIRRCAIDIEVKNKPGQFPSLETHDDPIIAVSFYANDGFKQVVALANDKFWGERIPENCIIVETEEQLIEYIFQVLNEYPIILTFNGDNFDLAYIHQRTFSFPDTIDQADNPIKFPIGNLTSTKFTKDPVFLLNTLHIDLFRLFSNVSLYNYGFNRKYSEYKLDSIAKAMLGEGKIETTKDKEHLSELTLAELVEYNLKDAELTLRLTTYANELVMKLLFTISRITKSSIEDIDRYGISRWARSMLYYEHRKKGVLIPNRADLERKGEASTQAIIAGKKFKGAFVMEPVVGSHFNVVVVDFASLYPTIIKNFNISYETINCNHDDCKTTNKIFETTHWYCDKRQGMLSLIIGVIRDLRVEYFKKLSKDKTLPKDEQELYDSITQASKVILNGSYGVVGSESFDLFCLPVAESVTALGRRIITQTKEYAERQLGCKVLYGDTDSLFILNPTDEQTDKLMSMTRDKFDIDLEVDKKFKFVIFSPRKKNYLGVYENGKIDTKGLTGKKSNIPPYVKNCFNDVINILKVSNDVRQLTHNKDDAIKCVQSYIANLRNHNYNLEDMQFSIKLKNDISSYGKVTKVAHDFEGKEVEIKKGVPAHIKAAIEIEKNGDVIEKDSFIRFIKTYNGAKPLNKCSKNDVHIDTYITQIQSTLEPIFDVLDIDFKTLLSPTVKQVSFDTMFS